MRLTTQLTSNPVNLGERDSLSCRLKTEAPPAPSWDQGLPGLHGQKRTPFTEKSHRHRERQPLPLAVRRLLFSQVTCRLSQLAYLAYLLIPSLAQAQPIIPASDGTRTTITSKDGKQFDIEGGQVSGDGGNLFHSFQQFGLSPEQTANFLSTPAIRNILARVTGGIPSVIDGLIQVSGGAPHLFLMNPAGIVFGQNAQLNVPGSFLATTANGIGFDNQEWFTATGTANYALLTGTPQTFSFPANPASIVNQGNLTVGVGQNLTLLGGSVISTGTLEAPGGQIHLVAVPGEGVVRISQTGHLLSLEIASQTPENGAATSPSDGITPITLPQMLTGGDGQNQATGVMINEAGQVVLTGNQGMAPGQVWVTGTLSAATVSEPSLQPGGTIEIVGERIAIQSATLDVSSPVRGGTVQVGAPRERPPTSVWGSHTYLSPDSVIRADGQMEGAGGQVQIQGSLDVQGHIQARGGVTTGNGGSVRLVGVGSFSGTVDVSAVRGEVGTVELETENLVVTPGSGQQVDGSVLQGEQLLVPETTLENLSLNSAVVAKATQDVVIQDLPDNQLQFQSPSDVHHPITFMADSDNNGVGSFMVLDTDDQIFTTGNHLSFSGERVRVGGIQANGGNIEFQANHLELAGGAGSIQSVGGELEIETRAFYQPVEIRHQFDAGVQSLQLTSTEIAALQDGFAVIKIGDQERTSRITIAESFSVSDPLILSSQTVEVNQSVITTDNGSVTINATQTDLATEIRTHSQDITLNSDVKLTDHASLNTGEAGGNIHVRGQVTSALNAEHNLTVTGGAGDVTFEQSVGNTFSDQIGRFSVASANRLTLSDLRVRSFHQARGLSTTQIHQITTPGGDVQINTQGDITAGTITTEGGTIQLTSETGTITAEVLDSSVTASESRSQIGGIISLNAAQGIHAQVLNSSGVQQGGDIHLHSGTGEMMVHAIDASSQWGWGGRVDISSNPVFNTITPDSDTLNTDHSDVTIHPTSASATVEVDMNWQLASHLESRRTQEFSTALGIDLHSPLESQSVANTLQQIAEKTSKKSAVIYVVSQPTGLELILVTPNGTAQIKRVLEANSTALKQQIRRLIGNISHRPNLQNPDAYLLASQQLYQWLIAPLEPELQRQNIDNLMFSLDPGLRSLPLASLHDGSQFLIEKYSLSLIPSLNLTDQTYQNLQENLTDSTSALLAMGAAEFQNQTVLPLPAVPLELSTITQDWPGSAFLNDQFTFDNLIRQRMTTGSPILHLATHGFFDPEHPHQSYIQLWDSKLHFDQLRQLTRQGYPLELLVLSACETAFGSMDRELGFAGLAVQSGVKSVIASLWQVDDAGTLGLMSEFYRQLSVQSKTYKAEALRQAQIAMIQGDLRVEAGQLRHISRGQNGVPLPSASTTDTLPLSHPYYWASFTMVGSPW